MKIALIILGILGILAVIILYCCCVVAGKADEEMGCK